MALGENHSKEKKHIALHVNGEKVEADIESRITLAEFLREELRLTGTKVGCNRAECGSCTVILDGEPVYSCSMLAVEASGTEILTIEGLANNANLHPLQDAFIEHDALQCGYCTPGMIMNATSLLLSNPEPSRQEVIDAMQDNLCRCGAHIRIIEAIQSAGQEMKTLVQS